MAKKKLFVCGRCGYHSHHRMKCPSCGFHLEDECVKCYSAKGNCVCRFHGVFVMNGLVKRPKEPKDAKKRLKKRK